MEETSAHKLSRYQKELAGLLASCRRVPREEPDFELAIEAAVPETGVADIAAAEPFPDALAPLLARCVQGSASPLAEVARAAAERIGALCGVACAAEACAVKIKLIAERKAYGITDRSAVVHTDTSEIPAWRWEVASIELFRADSAKTLRDVRAARKKQGARVRALGKVIETCARHPDDVAKVSQAEERVAAFAREDEAARQKALALCKKKADAESVKRGKQAKAEAEKKAKADEKACKKSLSPPGAPGAKKPRRSLEASAASQNLMRAFVSTASATAAGAERAAKRLSFEQPRLSDAVCEELERLLKHGPLPLERLRCDLRRGVRRDAALCVAKTTTRSRAETRRRQDDPCDEQTPRKRSRLSATSQPATPSSPTVGAQSSSQCCPTRSSPSEEDARARASSPLCERSAERFSSEQHRHVVLSFHHDCRPPFVGCVEKRSSVVRGRQPFARDEAEVDYECDSEAEFAANEAEVADGEDLSDDDNSRTGATAGDTREGDEDDEDDEEERELDYEDGFLRGDDDVDGVADGGLAGARERAPLRAQPLVLGPTQRTDDATPQPELAPYVARALFDPQEPPDAPTNASQPNANAPKKPAQRKPQAKKKDEPITGQKLLTTFFTAKKT